MYSVQGHVAMAPEGEYGLGSYLVCPVSFGGPGDGLVGCVGKGFMNGQAR